MNITITPKILSIEDFSSSDDFFTDIIYKHRVVTVNNETVIDEDIWNIPFQYIILKQQENICSPEVKGFENTDCFYKRRILNTPLFKLKHRKNYVELIRLLLRLDSNSIEQANSLLFNKISIEDLRFKSDIFDMDCTNKERKYEIRVYQNIVLQEETFFSFDFELKENCWTSPHIFLSGLDFPDEIIYRSSKSRDTFSINIVPYNYQCSFHAPITSEKLLWSSLYSSKAKEYPLYKGTYEECKEVFADRKTVFKMASTELAKQYYLGGVSPLSESNSDEDYFSAMSDGQLGDYNDFKEQGGDIDDIDSWSRG